MIRRSFLLSITLGLLTSIPFAQAEIRRRSGVYFLEVKDFSNLLESSNLNVDPEQLKGSLVVIDLDNTLWTVAEGVVGSEQWFDFVAAKLPNEYATDFAGLLALNMEIYEKKQQKLTEAAIPTVLASYEKLGAEIIFLTARGPKEAAITARNFAELKIELQPVAKAEGAYEPFGSLDAKTRSEIKDKTRPISYQHNVIFSDGQHKGYVLADWLARQNKAYPRIIFFDNKIKHLKNVGTVFMGSQTEVWSILHTGVDTRVNTAEIEAEWAEIKDGYKKH